MYYKFTPKIEVNLNFNYKHKPENINIIEVFLGFCYELFGGFGSLPSLHCEYFCGGNNW